MGKVYDTSFREMFARGLPALLPWLLPHAGECEVLKEDRQLATTSRWPDLVLRVMDVRGARVPGGEPGPAGKRAESGLRSAVVLQIVECQCQPDPP